MQQQVNNRACVRMYNTHELQSIKAVTELMIMTWINILYNKIWIYYTYLAYIFSVSRIFFLQRFILNWEELNHKVKEKKFFGFNSYKHYLLFSFILDSLSFSVILSKKVSLEFRTQHKPSIYFPSFTCMDMWNYWRYCLLSQTHKRIRK